MSKLDENMDWELEVPHLARLPKKNPFGVPENYFNELSEQINKAVFIDNLGKKENQGFQVPENYFEELSSQIESKIALDKIKALNAEASFKVPENYFEKLNSSILSKTVNKVNSPKVLRLWQTNLFKYASAACFILLTAFGLYINQQSTPSQQTASIEVVNENLLYDIDESTILEHIQEQGNNAIATPVNITTNKEVEDYILNHFSSNDLSNNL